MEHNLLKLVLELVKEFVTNGLDAQHTSIKETKIEATYISDMDFVTRQRNHEVTKEKEAIKP